MDPETATTETKRPKSHRAPAVRRLAIIAVIIAGFFLVTQLQPLAPLRTSAGAPGWRLFREPRHAWTVQFPAKWTAQRIKESYRTGRTNPKAYGIFIANVDRPLRRTNDFVPPEFDLRSAGSDVVAVRIGFMYNAPWAIRCPGRHAQLRLSLEAARTARSPIDPSLTELSLDFADLYAVTAWVGPDATAEDQRRLERIIASVRWDQSRQPSAYNGADCYPFS